MDPVLNLGSKSVEVGRWRLGQGWACVASDPARLSKCRRSGRGSSRPPHPGRGKPAPIEGTGASRVDIAALFFRVFGDVLIRDCLGMRVVLVIWCSRGRSWDDGQQNLTGGGRPRGRIHSRAGVELSGRGHDGGYDAVRRYSMRWSKERGQSTAVLTYFSANAPAGGLLGVAVFWSHHGHTRQTAISVFSPFINSLFYCHFGALGEIRTPDPQIRSLVHKFNGTRGAP